MPDVKPEVEELRVAMALNGGVSLAVWMGGCAVELDRARRASTGQKERRIYDELCACFGRQLVIDILSGASAGGINGGLLSAAMVKGRQLDPVFVRERWLDFGDLAKLLRDASETDPPALLNGDLFHRELLHTFEGVLGERAKAPGFHQSRPSQPSPVTVPSLDVTMTDVIGVERRFKDAWDNDLVAREHRPRFKFRKPAHFTAGPLAAAARTSASFPVAFEPWRVDGNARVLASLPTATYGIDGGLLDNAPIRAALDMIPTKPAGSRVLRYVCYLNGDPPQPGLEPVMAVPPNLRDVGGYVVNLPRVAPFVDQLYAIQKAVERPRLAEEVQWRLLELGIDELTGVAGALLETYRQRRTMQSLEELLTEPGDATAMNALLNGTEGHLPWIPFGLEVRAGGPWHWGTRPAQRILHLLLDLLRPAIDGASDDAQRAALLVSRSEMDIRLEELRGAHNLVTEREAENDPSRIDDETPIDVLQRAAEKATEHAPQVLAAVRAAAKAFFAALREHPGAFGDGLPQALFGVEWAAGQPSEEMLAHFFRRVLSIEVVRRAFSAEADIDSAEELRFIQLTPAAPSPIFTEAPLSGRSPASAEEKLTGIGLGHFAGFYRRSWRANDFMWGRLDAAARIVDLLLDRPSKEVGVGGSRSREQRVSERCERLVKALLAPDRPAERHWLLEEALQDATAPLDGEPAEAADADLEERLKPRIEAELRAAEDGGGLNRMPFIRAVFQRAAQLEIVADELPVVRSESERDRKQGSAAAPLRFGSIGGDAPSNVEAEIEGVRKLYEAGESLPGKLKDPEEAVSDLGLRTITHGAFVALSALRTTGVPLAKFFGLVRTPLLAVAGTVARSRLYRATVVLGIWAAAVYVTSRLVTGQCTPTGNCKGQPAFSDAWSLATFTALVAALGVLGVAAVPGLRAWRGLKPLRNAPLAVGLLGFAGGLAAVLAWTAGELDSLPLVLFPPHADKPPQALLLALLFAVGVLSAARLPLPGWLGGFGGALEKLRAGKLLALPLIFTFLSLWAWGALALVREADQSGWQAASAFFAIVCAPTVAVFTVALWESRKPPSSPAGDGSAGA